MPTTYERIHPDDQLAMLDAEAGHLRSLHEGADMWVNAMSLLARHTQELALRKEAVAVAWTDVAGSLFVAELHKCVTQLEACKDAIFESGVSWKMTWLSVTHGLVREEVRKVCERYKAIRDAGEDSTAEFLAHCSEAGMHTARFDHEYHSVIQAMRTARDALRWYGPRIAVDGTGGPGGPGGPATSGSPTSAGTGDPVSAQPRSPAETPAPETAGEQPDLSEALSAASDALGAAEGLLGGGMQVPEPISPGDLGFGDVPSANYANHAPTGGLPTLAGLDAGASFAGGIGGAGPTAVAGPDTGGAVGAGNAPVPGGFAATAAGRPVSGAPMMPPMHPPNAGAGAARSASAIRSGDSDRRVAAARPRPRAAGQAVTPGIALTGRAGAAAPKPAARREWDSANDSLQVLDENLWLVNPQEEETHGQDRRGSGRDGRDRATAHPAADAGLVGPGRRADQPPGAR
ncbi:hypothetical protein [Actinophytocola sp. NPDC049390]|uniref:hypothetical protein n=1 Tax=Actinophytocola sp. NPDC049390 TaxID=3363894 RepID=UPI0037B8D825